jgi:prepilin-type N-terminal cleavage/methylation domain-containing protein
MEKPVETLTTATFPATTEDRQRDLASAGFTLIEIVVVVTIIAIAAVIAIPNIGAGARQREVRSTLQKFVSTVRRASSVAVFQRKPVELRIFVDEGAYAVVVPADRSDEEAALAHDAEGRASAGRRGLVGRGGDAAEGAHATATTHRFELPEIASFGDVTGGRDLDDEGIVFDFMPNGSSSGGGVELLFESPRGRPESFRLVINPLVSDVSFEDDE